MDVLWEFISAILFDRSLSGAGRNRNFSLSQGKGEKEGRSDALNSSTVHPFCSPTVLRKVTSLLWFDVTNSWRKPCLFERLLSSRATASFVTETDWKTVRRFHVLLCPFTSDSQEERPLSRLPFSRGLASGLTYSNQDHEDTSFFSSYVAWNCQQCRPNDSQQFILHKKLSMEYS